MGKPSFQYANLLRNDQVFPQNSRNLYVFTIVFRTNRFSYTFNGEFETAKRRLEVSDCSGMRDYVTTMFSEAIRVCLYNKCVKNMCFRVK